MSSPHQGDQDYAAAYEELVGFLYLAPVGILKFAPDGTIAMANPAAAKLLMPLTEDGDMSDLYGLLSGIAPDLRVHVERFQPPEGQIFDQMQLVVPRTRSTLMLDINKIDEHTLMAVVQNITDLTEARRELVKQTESQRLLASVFMRINTPVVVVRNDGFILVANTAFQSLFGYDARGLVGLNIDAILPPDCTGETRAAQARQLLAGGCYQIRMEVFARDGTRSRVLMNSALLRESDERPLRAITLIPDTMLSNPPAERDKAAQSDHVDESASQIRVISLSKMRLAISDDWPAMGQRAMLLAERMIKRLLAPDDVIKRLKDDSFVVWFCDANATRSRTIVAKSTIAITRLLLTEFGPKIATRVKAAVTA